MCLFLGNRSKKGCVYWANSSILAQMNIDISYRVSEVALVKLLAGPVSGWGGFQRFSRTHLYTQIQKQWQKHIWPLDLHPMVQDVAWIFSKNPDDSDIGSPNCNSLCVFREKPYNNPNGNEDFQLNCTHQVTSLFFFLITTWREAPHLVVFGLFSLQFFFVKNHGSRL
jgi:hypothetical protein